MPSFGTEHGSKYSLKITLFSMTIRNLMWAYKLMALSIKYFKIILFFLPRYLCGNNMIKMTSESSCQSENIIILLPGVPQILNLTIQLNIDRLVSFTQPLVNRLSAALVSGDGPVLDALQLIVDAWTGCCGHCWTRPS